MAEKKPGVLNKAWNSRAAAWTAAAVIGAALLLTLALIVWNTVDTINADDGGQSTAPAVTQPSASASLEADGCDVPVGDTDLRPAIPADLRWEAANGGTWPVSDTYGPTQDENGFGVCFAQSPLGAALAAASFWTSQYNDKSAKAVLQQYLLDSAGKEAAISTANGSTELPTEKFPIAGFTVDAFSPEEAIITTVSSASSSPTGFVGVPMTLVWSGEDWKVRPDADGTYAQTQLASAPVEGQFVSWGDR